MSPQPIDAFTRQIAEGRLGFTDRFGNGQTVSPEDPLPATGRAYRFAGLITRPTNQTPYAVDDAIGDVSGSAIIAMPNIGPPGGSIQIQSIRLLAHTGTLPSNNGSGLRLHFSSTLPTAIADNAAWDLLAGDRAGYLDSIDLPSFVDYGSTLFCRPGNWDGSMFRLAPDSTTLYAVLTNRTANLTFAENSTVLGLRVNAFEAGR
jgi:hypothetical protein